MNAASASQDRLTPVSIVVLGFIDRAGELTSYELKARVERSVGYFWPFPHTQLYDEPKRLADLGLLSVRAEESGRRRRLYSITDAGRTALDDWLDEPAQAVTRIQDTGLLQLFFAATSTRRPGQVRGRLREVARTQIEAHAQRLAEYDRIEQVITSGLHIPPLQVDGCVHRTLSAGRQIEQTMIDFWQEIADTPPGTT